MGLLWQPGDTELKRIDREALLAATAEERVEWLRRQYRAVNKMGDLTFVAKIDGAFFADGISLTLSGESWERPRMFTEFERRLHE